MTMSLPDDATDPDQIFMDWITEAIQHLKDTGVSRTAAAGKGKVSRNATYEWEGRGKKGFSRPKPETIKTFCAANGLDWKIPFRIYGWDTSGKSFEELHRLPPEQSLDLKIRRLEVRLQQKPPPEERRKLEVALVRARQMRDLGASVADEVMKEFGIG